MKIKFLFILAICGSCSMEKLYLMNQRKTSSQYEQMNFADLIKKYVDKDKANGMEGIYSVSSVVVKKSKGLFSSVEKEKEVSRKENYAQVAIIRDNGKNNREYIEVPIDNNHLPSYSVRGEFTSLSGGNILVLKHFEPKGQSLMYSFTYDQEKDILEGIRTESNNNSTVTYKLTFIKLYPKSAIAHK